MFCHLQVKHSRTSSPSSYEKDFRELIDIYTRKKCPGKKHYSISEDPEDFSDNSSNTCEADGICENNLDNFEDDASSENDDEVCLPDKTGTLASKEKKLSVEYLEDECDLFHGVDDFDGNSLSLLSEYMSVIIKYSLRPKLGGHFSFFGMSQIYSPLFLFRT